MPINIDVVADGGEFDHAILRAADMIDGEVRCSSVSDMVQKVRQRAGDQKIRRLRVYAHGNAGVVACGRSPVQLSLDNSAQHIERHQGIYIAAYHHRATDGSGRVRDTYPILNDLTLRRLRGMFERSSEREGYVELHVCNVAEGPLGEALLQGLANILRCRVYGSPDRQVAGGGFEGTRMSRSPQAA